VTVREQSTGRRPDSPDLLRRIVAVGRSLAETRDQTSICRALREFVSEYVSFDTFLVTLVEPDTDLRRCVFCWGDGIEVDPGLFEPLPLNDGPASQALLGGQAVVCDDVADDSLAALGSPGGDTAAPRSFLIVPMASGGRVIGSIQLQKFTPGFYSAGDIVPLAAVVDHAAAAIENARLLGEAADARRMAERAAAREATLNRVGAMLYSALDPREVVSKATRAIRVALDAHRATFFTMSRDGQQLVAEYEDRRRGSAPIEGSVLEISRLPGEQLDRLRSGEAVVFEDIELTPFFGSVASTVGYSEVKSGIQVPIIDNGVLTAMLFVGDAQPRTWETEEIALVRGVSEQMAVALRQSELYHVAARTREEWERTFDAMADAVALVDADDRVIRANAAFWAMAGRDTPALGEQVTTLMHDSPEEAAACDACIERRAGREGALVIVQPSAKHRFGIHLEVTLNRVEAVSDGRPGMVQVVRDITAVRTAEAQIRNRQAVLDTVLSSMTDAIALLDATGTVLWGNPSAAQYGEMMVGGMQGLRVWDFVGPESQAVVQANFAKALAGESTFIEYSMNLPDGTPLTLECNLMPVVEGNRVTGVVATARDVTERRTAMERAVLGEKLRALGQLSAGVAHDFNNLLTAILGHVQLLSRMPGLQEPGIERQLGAIERAARDGAETVRRIQTFTRVRFEDAAESVPVRDLLEQSVEMARPRWKDQAQAIGARILVEVDDIDPGLAVVGSGAELREVVTNLVMNAVDAMPAGGHIRLSADRDGDSVLLRVRDTGHGIDDETRRRIFEPFFTTRGPQNSGLGLAVSYGIVTRHGGRIEIESEPGATVFTVWLPADLRSERTTAERPHPEGANVLTHRVLVVDDDESVRDMVTSALSGAGADVVTVGSGREAIAAVLKSHFDVVVTDLGMPDVNGWDVARYVHRIDPGVRILVLTGWGDSAAPDADNEEVSAAVERVLAKPIDIDDLIAVVRGGPARDPLES